MYQGQTGKAWGPTLTYDNGNAVSLAGLLNTAFTLFIHDTKAPGSPDRTGAGTFTIVNAATGLISYKWNAADTSVVGSFLLFVQYVDVDGSIVDCDPVPWQVKVK